MANIQVAVVNQSTVLTDDQVAAAVPALQTQVSRDFAPVWGIDADLTFVPQGSQPGPNAWCLVILNNSDQAGALGYHDLTDQGMPLGKVFAGTDIQTGSEWTVTASHELLEMLADPDISLTVLVQSNPKAGTLYAYEVCDACEADQYAYSIDTTLVSDFVYPAWFESFREAGSTQFDHGSQINKPFELLPGGYIGVLDIRSHHGWQQLTAQGSSIEYAMRPRLGSRRERRRTPRHHWCKSNAKQAD
jgi:hypothetical protein